MGERFIPYEARSEEEKAFHDQQTKPESSIGDRVEDVDLARDRAELSQKSRIAADKLDRQANSLRSRAGEYENGEFDQSEIINKFYSLVEYKDPAPSRIREEAAKRFLGFFDRETAKELVNDYDRIIISKSVIDGKERWFVNCQGDAPEGTNITPNHLGYEVFEDNEE